MRVNNFPPREELPAGWQARRRLIMIENRNGPLTVQAGSDPGMLYGARDDPRSVKNTRDGTPLLFTALGHPPANWHTRDGPQIAYKIRDSSFLEVHHEPVELELIFKTLIGKKGPDGRGMAG